MDASPVLERLAATTPARGFLLVGIGGRGGSGKTTLAHALPDAQIVGTDEFWDGSGFDLDRLRREVVDVLCTGHEAHYRGYDWGAGAPFDGERVVRPSGLVVIEGVCALHRTFRDDYDLRVWVEAGYETRLARGLARDGDEARAQWVDVWMPMEDRYVAADDPVAAADIVVDGGT